MEQQKIANGGLQYVPQIAAQYVYLDFDGEQELLAAFLTGILQCVSRSKITAYFHDKMRYSSISRL